MIVAPVTTNDIKIAIEIVCDCLDDVHTDLLVKSYEFPSSEVLPKYQTGKRLADWQIELEVSLLAISYSIGDLYIEREGICSYVKFKFCQTGEID